MILSTSVKTRSAKWSVAWFCISIFCSIFTIIYEIFSHGVYSNAMIYLFAYPLLLGAIPCYILEKKHLPMPSRFYQDGVFTMTLASLLGGIFEIYGTSSEYVTLFMYGGIILVVIGICLTIFAAKHTL